MKRHYYVVNGLMPGSSFDENRLDKLLGMKGYIGNVTEKLIQKGYVLDENKKALYAPDGARVCDYCEVR